VQVGALFQADSLERELLAGCVTQQQSFEDGLDNVVAAVGHRHGDAERLADLDVLRSKTSRTIPSMPLSVPYSVTARTVLARCPNLSTRPSRCSCRVGFQARS